MSEFERLPAWSLLSRAGVAALVARPDGGPPPAIRLGPGLDPQDAAGMSLLATTRLMLARAQVDDGLALTATHALSRADTRALFDALSWPDYDKAEVLAVKGAQRGRRDAGRDHPPRRPGRQAAPPPRA